MKVSVIQPYYSFNGADNDKCYEDMVALLDKCDTTDGIIVLPEYSDVPSDLIKEEEFLGSIQKYNADIMARAIAKAKAGNNIVFVNCAQKTDKGWANVTHAIDRSGSVVGKYFKAHPAPSEARPSSKGGYGLDVTYSYEFREPYVVEIDGIRFGFMTCYDFYFYEAFAPLARQNIDVIIGCSHQRTDTHSALSIINRFLCYNTNAYLIRSSVSLGEDSNICGCSCIIAPDGEVLADMRSNVGVATVDIDVKKKYYKQAGYKGAMKSHYEYIEEGRRPWLYRNGGASVVPFDTVMAYPRLCAHRGFSTSAPENTMPAFGSAVALGAKEMEFDLWETKDGEIVSCHDLRLERVSNGTGRIVDKTLAELKELDFGSHYSDKFAGLQISTFEEILQKFAGRVIMNIHIKPLSPEYNEDYLKRIIALVRKYDCEKQVYFMLEHDHIVKRFKEELAPDIRVCIGHDFNRPWAIVDRAIEVKADKVQLFKPYFTQEMIDKAKEHGIICNVFWSDDVEEAKKFLAMGVDTILTNDYLKISNALKIK